MRMKMFTYDADMQIIPTASKSGVAMFTTLTPSYTETDRYIEQINGFVIKPIRGLL